eukprot:227274-Ditylum_brightwellii.AAC.1
MVEKEELKTGNRSDNENNIFVLTYHYRRNLSLNTKEFCDWSSSLIAINETCSHHLCHCCQHQQFHLQVNEDGSFTFITSHMKLGLSMNMDTANNSINKLD